MGKKLQLQKDEEILRDEIEIARYKRADLLTSRSRLKPSLEEALQKKTQHILNYRGVVNFDDPEKFSEDLEELHRVRVLNIDETTSEEREILAAHLAGTTARKIGNIVGFLNSQKNTSYGLTKEYSKDFLEGSYEEIYTLMKMISDVGWHKTSAQGKASENTSLNKIMDKESIKIAGEISRFSIKNQETEDFPSSGLISSVQALRMRGWSKHEIKNVAAENRLDSVVYIEYGTKPRKTSGAEEIRRVMSKKVNKVSYKDTVQSTLSDVLEWNE